MASEQVRQKSIQDGLLLTSELSKVMAAEFKKLESEIKKYCDNRVKTTKISGSQIKPNSIPSTAVTEIPYQKVREFSAQVANIVALEAQSIVTDYLQTEQFQAYLAEIVYATIQYADIDWASISNLEATFATIISATIGSARIGFAQIDGLVAGTALITEGVGGKLFISSLAVTEANMVSLTVGELIVKGTDGKFYKFAVGEGGVVTTEVQVAGDNIANNTIAGENIIEGTITAREVNVTSLFVDSAEILTAIAGHIDVDTLFANETFTNELRTNLINSDIGGYLSIEGDDGVKISVKDSITNALSYVDVRANEIVQVASRVDVIEESIGNLDVDYQSFKTTVTNDASSFSVDIETIKGRTTDIEDILNGTEGNEGVVGYQEKLKASMKFSEEGVLSIRRSDSGIRLEVDNDDLSFKDFNNDPLLSIVVDENGESVVAASLLQVSSGLSIGRFINVVLADGSVGRKWV